MLSFLPLSLLAGYACAQSWQLNHNKIRNEGKASYGGTARENKIIQTNLTEKFAVDGTAIPFVPWDIGESYAGLLPTTSNGTEYYFWFFPSDNPAGDDEILIWLNGGPGCSSLEGLLQENGPFLWQYGTYRPVPNPWTWVNLTSVVWIDQPEGTGFSPNYGPTGFSVKSEKTVAADFLAFWKNFVNTFGLQNRKVYIAGESYAGIYIPYIADAMHNETDTEYYNIDGVMMYDPSLGGPIESSDVATYPWVKHWESLLGFNSSFMAELAERDVSCGYAAYLDMAMTFPPTGPFPHPLYIHLPDPCFIGRDVYNAATEVNPCFNSYHASATCPHLWDVLGFPDDITYEPAPWLYFNRTDVKKAINAPVDHHWKECQTSGEFSDTSRSPAKRNSVLPRVIEKNSRTIIGNGDLDFAIVTNTTIMVLNNMTWGGAQGFSTGPEAWHDFYVPHHPHLHNVGAQAGSGIFGKWWEERGLTICTVGLSGHMIPQFAPSAAYRHVEYLLGRISALNEVSDFTTEHGNYGNNATALNVTRH